MIEKITDQNLERYDSRLKEWCDRKFFEKGNYGKYQTTEESGIVTFYPAPNTLLEGKVKFSFKETMPVNEDKGPNNPSIITGVDSVTATKTGKNLLPTTFVQTIATTITATVNLDGSISINGSASNIIYVYFFNFSLNVNNFPNFLKKNVPYTMSFLSSSDSIYAHAYRSVNGESWGNNFTANIFNGQSDTFTIPNDTTGFLIRITIRPGTYSNAIVKLQIEEGSIATAFEPYEENNYTLSLGNTYYGGTIDLTTGVMTITHVECVADGTNIYAQSSVGDIGSSYRHAINVVTFELPAPIVGDYESSSSTHFTCVNSLFNNFGVFSQASQYIIVCDKDGLYPTNQSFNDWLKAQNASGTPVKFVYTIANPFTVSLTPLQLSALSQVDKYTPRLNTVYTDADSVQISYLKSPIRDEYEKTQAILSLGGNS